MALITTKKRINKTKQINNSKMGSVEALEIIISNRVERMSMPLIPCVKCLYHYRCVLLLDWLATL